MFPQTLGVIGLGAVGGSVAWHATRAGVSRVLGFATDPRDAAAAARAGAVTEIAHDPAGVLRSAELVVFAAPHDAVVAALRHGAGLVRDRRVVCTDVGSVKGPVVAEARRLGLAPHFAGSHPLVWFAQSGFSAAHPERLQRQVVYVTPADDDTDAGSEVADFWERVIGAHPVLVDPDRHDQVVAWTQLLPAGAAVALAHVLAERRPSGATLGPGALEATGPARADVALVVDALLLNREHAQEALEALGERLHALAALVRDGDRAALTAWFRDAAAWRSSMDR